jgi:hypothetical protein
MLRKPLLALSASMLLGTVVIAPNAALAQLPGPPPIGLGGPPLGGPPPGPPVGGPPPGLGAGGPPFGGPPPAHSFSGPPGGLEGGPLHGGAVAPSRSLLSMARLASMVLIMPCRATFMISKVVLQPSATPPETTSATATRTMATVMAAGDMATGDVMASMPMAAIPTPKAMAATTSPPTGAMFTGAFWFVPPTSRDKQSRTPRCRMHRGCIPERSSASSSQVFDHDHACYMANVLSSPPVLTFRHDRNLLGVKAAAAAKLSRTAFSPQGGATGLIRATPLSEDPQSAASRLIARPERSTRLL